jgi:ribonuclease HI
MLAIVRADFQASRGLNRLATHLPFARSLLPYAISPLRLPPIPSTTLYTRRSYSIATPRPVSSPLPPAPHAARLTPVVAPSRAAALEALPSLLRAADRSFFSDGSYMPADGRAGAAVVVRMPDRRYTYWKSTLSAPTAPGSFETELVGILLALYAYKHKRSLRAHASLINICTDCQRAIRALVAFRDGRCALKYGSAALKLVQAFHDALSRLPGLHVNLVWTPGHADVPENKLAHAHAQEAAGDAAGAQPGTVLPALLLLMGGKRKVRVCSGALVAGIPALWNLSQVMRDSARV